MVVDCATTEPDREAGGHGPGRQVDLVTAVDELLVEAHDVEELARKEGTVDDDRVHPRARLVGQPLEAEKVLVGRLDEVSAVRLEAGDDRAPPAVVPKLAERVLEELFAKQAVVVDEENRCPLVAAPAAALRFAPRPARGPGT